jgi:fucose 4-O-acetylase-like acetyltransferase
LKQRLLYIDQLKGLAILLVVMGHFIQYNTLESTRNTLFGIIYSFHMPLFMFLSGYIAQKTILPRIFVHYRSFLIKKTITLLVPFFAWPLIVHPFFFTSAITYHPLNIALTLIKGPEGGLWFLWFLFFLTLLFSLFLYISEKVNKNKTIFPDLIICTGQLLLLLLLRYSSLVSYTDSFMLYFIFFYLGVFISRFDLFTRIFLNTTVFSAALITFVVLCGHYDLNHSNIFIKLVLSFTAIISFYYTVRNVSWNPFIDKTVSHWGRYSLVIYTTQFKLITVLSGSLLLPYLTIIPLLCITLFFSLIIIIFCLQIFKLVRLSPVLDLLLYGNRKIA